MFYFWVNYPFKNRFQSINYNQEIIFFNLALVGSSWIILWTPGWESRRNEE